MISRYAEECKGLKPIALIHGYGWSQEELFDWLYSNFICNKFETMRRWLYRSTPQDVTLIAIYKAYQVLIQELPPKNPADIAKNIVDIEW